MRRRSLYYITHAVGNKIQITTVFIIFELALLLFRFIVSCFLISCMTLLGLLLSSDSGDKILLQITTLLTIVKFSLLLSEIMSPSSHAIPIITVYFICVMIMSVVSVIASVLVLLLHFRNSKNYTMPLWVNHI
ncbi:unnamed protein product [Rotaria sp. Silwood2]|nr:unnamed protein product [Rotaria sp. Silwood2]CAF4561578.1 unnamed protein product [Rotaria sp. Silwood2]